jgi:transposase InsO family protein
LGVQHHLYPSFFFYLTTVLDQYDRKIIGWTLSDGMSAEQTLWQLEYGYQNRSIEKVFSSF